MDYAAGGDIRYPAVYVTDGNVAAAMLAPYAEHTAFEPITAFQPYIQITVEPVRHALAAAAPSVGDEELGPVLSIVAQHISCHDLLSAGTLTIRAGPG